MNVVGVPDAYASTAGWQPARDLRLASYQQRHPSETALTTVLSVVSGQFRLMLRFTELPFRDWTVQTNSTWLPNPWLGSTGFVSYQQRPAMISLSADVIVFVEIMGLAPHRSVRGINPKSMRDSDDLLQRRPGWVKPHPEQPHGCKGAFIPALDLVCLSSTSFQVSYYHTLWPARCSNSLI